MLNTVINKLKEFSKKDFPVPEVSSYLLNLNIDQEELKNIYCVPMITTPET